MKRPAAHSAHTETPATADARPDGHTSHCKTRRSTKGGREEFAGQTLLCPGAETNVPSAQSLQEEAPPPLKRPAAQSEQALAPTPLNWPAAQAMHAVSPGRLAKAPAAHGVHVRSRCQEPAAQGS